MENMNDINHLDPNDDGLKAVMGSRFHDATKDPAPAKKAEPATVKAVEEKPARKRTDEAIDAKWAPVKPDPNWMDRLQACAKWTGLFGGLCLLFFYWQQKGLMDPVAALPSMIVCATLAGLSVGLNFSRSATK